MHKLRDSLNTLWKEVAKKGETRACLFNLLFYVREKGRAGYFKTLAEKIVQRIPARVLFAEISEEAIATSASVSLLSSGESKSLIVCERINFQVAEKNKKDIPSLFLPYLIPDLPTYLIFGGSPKEFSETSLIEYCDRVLFDSECAPDLSIFAHEIMALPKEKIGDLNWARLEDWRELMRSTFQSEERFLELKNASELSIVYNGRKSAFFEHTRTDALFLVAWLESAIGKDFEKEAVHFSERIEKDLPSGAILEMSIKTKQGMHFTFKRTSVKEVRITSCSQERCDMPTYFRFSQYAVSGSLIKELMQKQSSSHYLAVLKKFRLQPKIFDERRSILTADSLEEGLEYALNHFLAIGRKAIEQRGKFMVALSGGSTPKLLYERLKKEDLDWSKVWLFWSDERDAEPTHHESNYKMAMDAGFSSLPIPQTQIFRMKAEGGKEAEALAYEEAIQDSAFDLMMLGMGEDGHTASLFPGTKALSETKRLVLINEVPEKKTRRMTMTYPLINRSKNIVVYVFGKSKLPVLHKALQNDCLPISFVGTKEHPALFILA